MPGTRGFISLWFLWGTLSAIPSGITSLPPPQCPSKVIFLFKISSAFL